MTKPKQCPTDCIIQSVIDDEQKLKLKIGVSNYLLPSSKTKTRVVVNLSRSNCMPMRNYYFKSKSFI